MNRLAAAIVAAALLAGVVFSILSHGREPTSVQARARAEHARQQP